MTLPTHELSSEAQRFNWLLARFVSETAAVRETIAVSADGLLIAMSQNVARADADRLAAITSALTSLADGAARIFDLGVPSKVIIDMDRGYLLVSAISPGSVLGVVAMREANLGDLAYDIAMFANLARTVLTPQTIDELKTTAMAV
jgi:predicted regulator of Ras-like GTPase activity (Roadblock/LC7/MglB family)